MSKPRYSMGAASVDSDDGVQLMSRRKMDARKLFEESLQKVTRTSGRERDVESSELMQLLLTPGPVRASNDVKTLTATSSHASEHADLDSKKNAASCSTDKHEVFDLPASAGDDRASVFTSDKLDEYLANDRTHDTDAENASNFQDLDVKWNSLADGRAGKRQVSASSSSGEDEPTQSMDSESVSAPERRRSEVEVDIVDGFSFYSFSTSDALLHYIDDSSDTSRTGADAGGPPTKKFQYGIAGNMSKYLAKMKGWEKRTPTHGDQRADAMDALLSDGMLRKLSDTSALGLNLSSSADDDDDDDDEAVMTASEAGRAAVGRYPRRGVGKIGDEQRQPRRGKIYGRRFDGKFASLATIHYHIKRRRSPTTPYSAKTHSSASPSVASSRYSRISGDSLQSLTTHGNLSRLLSPNLQPRVNLTKAIVPPRTTSVTKDDVRLPYSKPKAYNRNTVVPKSSDKVHLIRLTEAAARRSIVALQLAPSMMNSPMKCNKPSMIQFIVYTLTI